MSFEEIAQNRYSCRKFDAERLVEKEKIQKALEVACLAPSACNSQPWFFTVCVDEAQSVNDSTTLAQISACMQDSGMNKFTNAVRCYVIISESAYNLTAKAGSILKKQDYKSNDIGIATAYLTSELHEQGLSTCILGWFNEKRLQKIVNIKERIRLVVAIGYAAPDDRVHKKVRKPIEQVSLWLS